GQLRMFVHFIQMDRFLKGIRDFVVKRFALEVQEELNGLVAPTETLLLLLQRLPNRPMDQISVLNVFRENNEPLSLEKLHERINKVLGTNPNLAKPYDDLGGDKTLTPNDAVRETVRLGDSKPLPAPKANVPPPARV